MEFVRFGIRLFGVRTRGTTEVILNIADNDGKSHSIKLYFCSIFEEFCFLNGQQIIWEHDQQNDIIAMIY